jgi:hypothetical protein
MPHSALVGFTWMLGFALDAYIGLCHLFPLPMRAYVRNVLAKFSPQVRRLTIYDQLNPTYAKYYSMLEAEALLVDSGFSDVNIYHRHGYSWSVLGVAS